MISITGVEVIRAKHTANVGFVVQAVSGEKIELTYGDRLRVNTSLEYKGPMLNATLYGAIGVKGIGFNEKVTGEADVTFPKADGFTPWSGSVDIPIIADIKPGTDYDLYVKIKEYPGAGMPAIDNVIAITGMPPSYELLEETIYPYAYVYEGKCETTTFTFKTDPFTPASWIAGRLAAAVESEVRTAGGRIMEMRVYCDKTPLLWSDWRIETVTKIETTGTAMSLGIWWLGPAILIALAIIFVIVVATMVIDPILALFKRNPALEDVKPAWKKETLISTIQDAEEYWERPPTPVETLDEMPEEELREYLDKIAEEEVAPPAEGLGIAIAAIAILGVGALAVGAYAMSKPKETRK